MDAEKLVDTVNSTSRGGGEARYREIPGKGKYHLLVFGRDERLGDDIEKVLKSGGLGATVYFSPSPATTKSILEQTNINVCVYHAMLGKAEIEAHEDAIATAAYPSLGKGRRTVDKDQREMMDRAGAGIPRIRAAMLKGYTTTQYDTSLVRQEEERFRDMLLQILKEKG